MKISELIKMLNDAKEKYGNVNVYADHEALASDDWTYSPITTLNADTFPIVDGDGCEITGSDRTGVILS